MRKLLVVSSAAICGLLMLLIGGVVATLGAVTGTGAGGSASYAVVPPSSDAQGLLSNPRLSLSSSAKADLAAGIVDTRLVELLAQLLTRHTLHVGVFKTGHSVMIVTDNGAGDKVSTHFFGRGVDIMSVDGVNVSRTNPAARSAVEELQVLLRGTPSELGQPWPDLTGRGTFTNRVHQDHIHVGLYE